MENTDPTLANTAEAAANSKVDTLFDQLENLAVEKLHRLEESNSLLEERLAKLEAALIAQQAPVSPAFVAEPPAVEAESSEPLALEAETLELPVEEIEAEQPTFKPKQELRQWVETYPEVFIPTAPKPLKIGIHLDLQQAKNLTEKQIKRVLANYVKLPRYFACIKAGANRINLQGEVCGQVTSEEEAFAQQQLDKLKQLKKANKKPFKPANKPSDAEHKPKFKSKPSFKSKSDFSSKPNSKPKAPSSSNKPQPAVNQPAKDKAFTNTALQDQLQKLLNK